MKLTWWNSQYFTPIFIKVQGFQSRARRTLGIWNSRHLLKKKKYAFTKLQKYTNQTDVQNVARLCERNLKMRIERTTDEREDYINRALTSRRGKICWNFSVLLYSVHHLNLTLSIPTCRLRWNKIFVKF